MCEESCECSKLRARVESLKGTIATRNAEIDAFKEILKDAEKGFPDRLKAAMDLNERLLGTVGRLHVKIEGLKSELGEDSPGWGKIRQGMQL